MTIHVLFKFAQNPYGGVEVDTTSSRGKFRSLSPFVLPAPPAKRLENLWQFSKVYPEHWNESTQMPNKDWALWSNQGYQDDVAHRYPMGKGRRPICSWWNGVALDYISARKLLYAPQYAKNVVKTASFVELLELCHTNPVVILRDYDAYDHTKMGMSLRDVINNPNKIMGHAFVLAMMLNGELESCLI